MNLCFFLRSNTSPVPNYNLKPQFTKGSKETVGNHKYINSHLEKALFPRPPFSTKMNKSFVPAASPSYDYAKERKEKDKDDPKKPNYKNRITTHSFVCLDLNHTHYL